MARGGARPGAGRPKGAKSVKTKPKPRAGQKPKIPPDIAAEAAAENLDPLAYMLKVMNDPASGPERRDRMAIAAAPFVHIRPAEKGGKKKEREEKAKGAASGRFAPASPPVLKAVK